MNYGFLDYQEWCKETDERKAQQAEALEKSRKDAQQAHDKLLNDFREKFGDHWYSTDVQAWIPLEVRRFPALDKVNSYLKFRLETDSVEQSAPITLLGSTKELEPYTIDEYHEKYCDFDEAQNKWFIKSDIYN